MHQQRSRLNFKRRLRLSPTSLVTSRVLKSVTMGMGACIQSRKASARFVSFGSSSFITPPSIFLFFFINAKKSAPDYGALF